MEDFNLELPDIAPQPGDDFAEVLRPPVGFAGRMMAIAFQLAGGTETDFDVRPLPLLPTLTREEMIALNEALELTDPHACLYGAAQHFHLGVPVVTVSVIVGIQHDAQAHLELRDRNLIVFMIDSNLSAYPKLFDAGRKMMRDLVSTALAEVVAHLTPKEP